MTGPTRHTLSELRAAAAALRDVAFQSDPVHRPATQSVDRKPAPVSLDPARLIVVLAAHPGAGASTTAVGIADAAAGQVQLVDAADPRRTNLLEAGEVELGEHHGWRFARRGLVTLTRPAGPVTGPGDLPPPPPGAGDQTVVVDVGWSPLTILDTDGWLADAVTAAAQLVAVTRATVPGLRHTEQLLGLLNRPVTVAVISGRCLPRPVAADVPPRVAAARDQHRLVTIPRDPRLEIHGVSGGPLPLPVGTATGRIAPAWTTPTAATKAPARWRRRTQGATT